MRNDALTPARHIVLVGPMGSGKSTLGRALAARLGLAFIDVDACIEASAGRDIPAIFASEGEAGFRERERCALAELLAGEGQLVATGGGAVLDAQNRQRIRERGFVVYLSAGIESQLKRLQRDRTRPLLQRADREQVLRELALQREPLYREVADLVMDTDGLTAADASARLSLQLAARWNTGEAAA